MATHFTARWQGGRIDETGHGRTVFVIQKMHHGRRYTTSLNVARPPVEAAPLPPGKVFERVGETRTRAANVRIVAATNRNLEAEADERPARARPYPTRWVVAGVSAPAKTVAPGEVPS
jgi:hypothetical protein